MTDRIKTIKKRALIILFKKIPTVSCVSVLTILFFAGVNVVSDTMTAHLHHYLKTSFSSSVIFVFYILSWFVICQYLSPILNDPKDLNLACNKHILVSLRVVTAKFLLIVALFYIPKATYSLFLVIFNCLTDYSPGHMPLLQIAFAIVFIFTTSVSYYFLSGFAGVPYIMNDNQDISVSKAISNSFHVMHAHKFEFIILKLSLIPWFVLSYFFFSFPLFFVLFYDIICERIFISYVMSFEKIPVFYSFSDEKD